MVGGQAHDKGAEGKTLSLSELMFLDQCKTGKLICASLDMASEIAGLSKNDKEAIHTYGKHIGLRFQWRFSGNGESSITGYFRT